jgi:hypothetical protein
VARLIAAVKKIGKVEERRRADVFLTFLPKSATFTFCCPERTFPSLIYFQA